MTSGPYVRHRESHPRCARCGSPEWTERNPGRYCVECNRERAREQARRVREARLAVGLSYDDYIATYGAGEAGFRQAAIDATALRGAR